MRQSNDIKGNCLRLWSICVKRVNSLGGPIVTVDGSSMSFADLDEGKEPNAKSKFSISRLASENQFDTAVYQWSLMAHTLGIMTFEISSLFIYDVAHVTRVKHGEDFWLAQEYLIACFDLIDRKVCIVSEVPNWDRNVMLSDARNYAKLFSDAHRGKGGGPSVETGKKSKPNWNGEFQAEGSKATCCPYYNKGLPHETAKHLDAKGKCIFRHVCHHWVTDKGKKWTL